MRGPDGKYVHLIVNTAYTAPYIAFVNKHFGEDKHVFFVLRGWSESKVQIPRTSNVIPVQRLMSAGINVNLMRHFYQAKKIIIHGLFSRHILLLLRIQPWLLKKTAWIVWGADLYKYAQPRHTPSQKIEEYLRRFAIRRFNEIISAVKGDYDLAAKWYQVKGPFRFSIYPTPLDTDAIDKALASQPISPKTDLEIQIGNSATRENNHFDILHMLNRFKGEPMHVSALLSYGDGNYAQEVIREGRASLGDKFTGITEYMKYSDFVKFMNRMDVIVFNHKRQQAFGNLLLAFYLKKKIYINEESPLWQLFNEQFKFKVYPASDLESKPFAEIGSSDPAEGSDNQAIVREIISESYVRDAWSGVFA